MQPGRGQRGEKETPVDPPEGGKDDRTEPEPTKTKAKGGSLTKDTPRDAATSALALRLHLHNVSYNPFKN